VTLVVFVTASGACDSNPVKPSVQATQTTTPAAAGAVLAPFHISGVVTNEDGQPLLNAEVVINRITALGDGKPDFTAVTWTETRTDAQGRYEMDIEAARNAYHAFWLTDIVAFGYAHTDTGEYANDTQFFTSATSTVVRNFRLNRFVQLAAGDSATVTFRPDDGVCAESDFLRTLCRHVRISVPTDGTLTVSAAPLNGVTAPAFFIVVDDPLTGGACPCGPGSVTYPVLAGTVSLVAIGIPPVFSQPQSYAVTTVFRPGSK
jgi:hypothetical protein